MAATMLDGGSGDSHRTLLAIGALKREGWAPVRRPNKGGHVARRGWTPGKGSPSRRVAACLDSL